MIHELKTDPEAFDAVANGTKTFEIRKSDRPFARLDVLHLRRTSYSGQQMAEGAPLEYNGPEAVLRVVGIMQGPIYGLQDGWCILSIVMLEQDWRPMERSRIARYDDPPNAQGSPTANVKGDHEAKP